MAESPTILVVDDEEDIVDLLRYNLVKEGYRVTSAENGVTGLQAVQKEKPDLVILDVMMPQMDGLEACRAMRQVPGFETTPVIMLTARGEESDHVAGLDVGADIYLTKPISIPVLMSQVRACLRSVDHGDKDVIERDGLLIDRLRYVVEVEGKSEPLHLPRKEFELLRYLAARPGRVFSRQELLDSVWGTDVYVVDRTVDVHIRKIREKVGEKRIETVKGVGYRYRG